MDTVPFLTLQQNKRWQRRHRSLHLDKVGPVFIQQGDSPGASEKSGILWSWERPLGTPLGLVKWKGPHLEGRQEPQGSSPFLIPIAAPCIVGPSIVFLRIKVAPSPFPDLWMQIPRNWLVFPLAYGSAVVTRRMLPTNSMEK